MRRWFNLLVLLLLGAQTINAQKLKSEVRTWEIDLNNGSRVVNKILTNSNDGFIWYTTNNGVVKDYGNSHSLYSTQIENAPQFHQARDLVEDANGRLVMTTNNGLFILNIHKNIKKWIRPDHPFNEGKVRFTNLVQGKNSELLAGSVNGSVYKLGSENDLTKIDLFNSEDTNDSLRKPSRILKVLDDGVVIVASDLNIYAIDATGNSRIVLDAKNWFEQPTTTNPFIVLTNGQVFESGSSGEYSLNNEVYRYQYLPEYNIQIVNTPNESWQTIKNYEDYFNLSIDVGRLFLAFNTEKIGLLEEYLMVKDGENYKAILFDSLDFNEYVEDVAYKINKTLWCSTSTQIFKARRANTNFSEFLTDGSNSENGRISAREMQVDAEGNIYVGSYSDIFKIDTKTNSAERLTPRQGSFVPLESQTYRGIYLQNDEFLWAVSEDNFLRKIRLSDLSMTPIEFDKSLLDTGIALLKIDKYDEDRLILGSNHGVWLYDLNSKKFNRLQVKDYQDELDRSIVSEIIIKGQSLWISTRQNGLFYKNLASGDTKHYDKNSDPALYDQNIMSIAIDDPMNSRIIIGTETSLEILDLKNENITVYNGANGLEQKNISSIISTKDKIWMGTFDGLISLEKKSGKFSLFTKEDGLPFNEFNMQSRLRKNDSSLFFGGINGVINFNPNKLQRFELVPRLKLVSLEHYSKAEDSIIKSLDGYDLEKLSISQYDDYTDMADDVNYNVYKIDLPHDQNYFNAKFAIDNLFAANKNQYFVRNVEDENDTWHEISTSSEIRAFNLETGTNAYLVKGLDADGIEAENQILLIAEVDQVFYKAWWFISLIGLLVLAFIAWRIYENVARKRRIHKRKIKRIELESRALRAQMNPHFISNALNGLQSVMILKGEKAANEYIATFSSLLRSTIKIGHDDMLLLSEEIVYLESYLKLEKLRQPRLEFTFDVQNTMDPSHVSIPCFLFQPVIENSIVHGLLPKKEGDCMVEVVFYMDGELLVGSITDNGIGRVASEQKKKEAKFKRKSWSTTILRERIDIINYLTSKKVDYKIDDLYDENKAAGTRVVIKVPVVHIKDK